MPQYEHSVEGLLVSFLQEEEQQQLVSFSFYAHQEEPVSSVVDPSLADDPSWGDLSHDVEWDESLPLDANLYEMRKVVGQSASNEGLLEDRLESPGRGQLRNCSTFVSSSHIANTQVHFVHC